MPNDIIWHMKPGTHQADIKDLVAIRLIGLLQIQHAQSAEKQLTIAYYCQLCGTHRKN